MPRARTEVFDPMMEVERPSRCMRFLRLLWKFSRCVFSHVTLISLVVAYCLIGAYAFEALEANHEKEVNCETPLANLWYSLSLVVTFDLIS